MLLDPTDSLRSLEMRAVATITDDTDLEFRHRVGARYGFPVADDSRPHVVVTFTPEHIRGSDDDFVSHDPNIDGREGLVGFVEWLNAHHQSSHIDVHHEFVSGDLVAIHHTDRHGHNTELAVVDILRIVDGRITEYWGVVGANRAGDGPV